MAFTAADIPGRIDLLLNGQGYILSNVDSPRARYSQKQTFVERSNTDADYGDDQQDFWLTATQRDWSLGEDQKFFRAKDPDSVRKCWRTDKVNIFNVGRAIMMADRVALTFSANVIGAGEWLTEWYTCTATNLMKVQGTTITDLGAHGAGTVASKEFAADQNFLYIAGGTNLRSWNGAAFATFSATPNGGAAFLSNVLYNIHNTTGIVNKFSTAGAATTVYTFQSANGTAEQNVMWLAQFGGKVLIIRNLGGNGDEIWQYDGTGVSLLHKFPLEFSIEDVCVSQGLIFILGSTALGTNTSWPRLYVYADGTIATAWTSSDRNTNGGTGGITSFGDGVAFTDQTTQRVLIYDIGSGGVRTLFSYTASGGKKELQSNTNGVLMVQNSTTSGYKWPQTSPVLPTSATLTTSLFDFDSSLVKLMRGITVDFDAATDGDGGSVDIAYRLNNLDGSFTTLQTTAVSGTEYLLTNITARSISVQVTLSKGTSSGGPTLKRIYVRAVPILPLFREWDFLLDCTGRNGKDHVILRNGESHPKDGLQMAQDIKTAIASQTPISMTDRFGTYNVVLEGNGTEIDEVRPEEFSVKIHVREV